jgi:transposase-like protein
MRPHRDGARVLAAYRATRSLRGAGEVLDCSASTVRRQLQSLGVPRGPARRKRRPSFPPGQAEEIIRRYRDENQSLTTLAREFNCSEGKIRRLLEFEGVPIRRRGRPPGPTPPPPPAADVLRLHGQGLRPADIAGQLDCAKQSVVRILRAARLTPNRGKPLPPVSELRGGGRTVRALAQHYGVSEDRIRAARQGPPAPEASAAQPRGLSDQQFAGG